MSRATAMNPDERRRAIIDAVVPLLLEHGTELSTRQLAEVAGVAEGTLFRVFESKQELIAQAALAALEAEPATVQLAELPQRELSEQVTAILEILQHEIRRTRALMMVVFHHGDDSPGPHHGNPHKPFHQDRQRRMTEAITLVLQEYAAQLRLPPRTAAEVLQAMAFASTFHFNTDRSLTEPAELAQVIIHGIALGAP